MARPIPTACPMFVIPILVLGAAAHAGPPQFRYVDETDSRLVADPEVGSADENEKRYAWGDVDQDGDIDLVVARKQPFSSTGRRTNVLLMNENGVLVDRTDQYAWRSDPPGDMGFLKPTNDRDVKLADLNGDGWLDVVTATTLSEGLTKLVGHPRIYINLGAPQGAWLGFRYDANRIPQLYDDDKQPQNPRFSAVAVGDVTGDGAPDLYFTESELGGGTFADMDDRLLVNDGNGFFTDLTDAILPPEMTESVMSTSAAIMDMNGDGRMDIIKTQILAFPVGVKIAYDLDDDGFFDFQEAVYQLAATYSAIGPLNDDAIPDIVVTDDGTDRYLIGDIPVPGATPDYTSFTLGSESQGFGGNSHFADLDGDGDQDVVITDVDFEIPSCSRNLNLYRNDLADGGGLTAISPEGIAAEQRTGTHDVAIFDLTGDGTLDLIVGRCTGTIVFVADPAPALTFEIDLPATVPPDQPYPLGVTLVPSGDAVVAPGTEMIFAAIDDGAFTATPLTPLGGDAYEATLPAAPCGARIRFYLSATTTGGFTFTEPVDAPVATRGTSAAFSLDVPIDDDFEGDVSGWTVENDPSLTSGAWEAVDPEPTMLGGGLAAPDDDATPDPGVIAFVTQNGIPGGAAGAADVDGGPTRLVSPLIDATPDAIVSYQRWVFTNDLGTGDEDPFVVEVSNDDGASWTVVESQTSTDTGRAWEPASFVVGDVLEPTRQVRVRFSIADVPNNSITEAGVDDVRVETLSCCPTDLNVDGITNFQDLLLILAAWGPCVACPEDFDGNGDVGFPELLAVLSAWGDCE